MHFDYDLWYITNSIAVDPIYVYWLILKAGNLRPGAYKQSPENETIKNIRSIVNSSNDRSRFKRCYDIHNPIGTRNL